MRFNKLKCLFLLFIPACHTSDVPKENIEASPIIGGLQPQEVQTVIKKNLDRIQVCYELNGLNDGVSGRLTFRFVIDGAGRIKKNQLTRDRMQIPALETCVIKAMGSWQFPTPRNGLEVTVNYPFLFDLEDEVTVASQATYLQTQLDSSRSCNNELSSQQDLILKLRIQRSGTVDASSHFIGANGRTIVLPCSEKLLKSISFPVPKVADIPIFTFFIGVNMTKGKTQVDE